LWPNHALILCYSALENTLRQLIRACRDYFPAEATTEMMTEWRPLLCPFDVTMGKAMAYFEMFLPTLDVKERAESTYKLWFDEFMSFWDACLNAPPWEAVSLQTCVPVQTV
jgi:proteasome activator subunit 4